MKKVLLDECVPWPLYKILPTCHCTTAQKEMWASVKNGELLKRAEEGFDLFITSDQNMAYQQNLQGRRIAILMLSTNNLRRIVAAAAILVTAVDSIQRGEFHRLEIP